MIIKKFIAPSVAEALAKVKSELGDQAVILKTRMNRKTDDGNGSNGKNIEVTAAVDSPSKSRIELSKGPEKRIESAPDFVSKGPSEKLNRLSQELADIKKILKAATNLPPPISFFGHLSADMLSVGRQLIQKGVSEELAFEMISKLAKDDGAGRLDQTQIKIRLKDILRSLMPEGEAIQLRDNCPTIVMFVGATGSGKTSAVARLAMRYKVEKNNNVAVISADNFRADSSRQIKALCRILGCPCAIVYTSEEISMAVKSQAQGLVLIDTPGVNPRDNKEVGELVSLIKAANPHEIHLVASASTPCGDILQMIDAFGEVGIDKVFVTKIDETMSTGGIITALVRSGKKLSYVSRSREIPGQFGVAISESLAEAVLSGEPDDRDQPRWNTEVVGIW